MKNITKVKGKSKINRKKPVKKPFKEVDDEENVSEGIMIILKFNKNNIFILMNSDLKLVK